MRKQRQTILIVDDCEEDREVYRRYLGQDSKYSYKIFEEEDGENGLLLCNKIQPDVILLDYLLPDMDGLEFLGELKIQTGKTNLPAIMLTGQGNEAIAVAAIKNGAQDYLVKGRTTPDSLRLAIHNAIERGKLQRKLEASEERFRTSVENMLDCFGIYKCLRDESGKIVDFIVEYVNNAACKNNCMSAEEQIGKKLGEILPAHRETGLFEEYCQVVETGEPLYKEAVIYSDNYGKQYLTRAFDISVSKLGDGLVATWRDISERKRSSERLRLLECVVVNAKDAVIVTEITPLDEPGPRIIYVNEAFTKMTGYSLEEIVGKSPRFLQGPKTNQAILNQIRAAIVAKETIQVELINYRKDGSELWVEMSITPVPDSLGNYTHFVSIQRDITERKRTEEALRQSREFIQQIADTIPGILYVYDLIERRNVYGNRQMAEVVGYTPEQIQAMGSGLITQLFHPEDVARIPVFQEGFNLVTDDEIIECEYRVRHANGEWRWFYGRDVVFSRTVDGLPHEVLGIAQDITARKQAEANLQQRIEQERLVMEIAQQIRRSLNLDEILQATVTEVRRLLECDRALIFQLEPNGNGTIIKESVGSDFTALLSTNIYDPCLSENYIEPFRQGLVTAKTDIYTAEIKPCHVELLTQLQVRANLVVPILQGENLWGLLIAHQCAATREWQSLEIDLLKQLATQVGIAIQQAELYQQLEIELSERVSAEAEINRLNRELECRVNELQTLLDLLPVGIAIADDPNCKVIRVNPFLQKLLTLAPDTNASKTGSDADILPYKVLIDGKEIPGEELPMQVCGATGVEIPMTEMQVVRDDGAKFDLLGHTKPLFDEEGKVRGCVGAYIDISDRKRVQAERDKLLELEQKTRAEAEAANRAKDDFVAMVSHDLRAPLNSILGWAQLLRKGKMDDEAKEKALETIERNAKSQAKLLEDLLDVSRMIQGKLEIYPQPIELVPIIQNAIDTAYITANEKGICLISALDASIGKISCDPNRLQQVLGNLLSNAIKFTPEGGEIDVWLEQVEGYAQIVVRDTGQGINPEFLPHVFDRFRQSSSGSKKGGLGLGLAIARHLIELHGGTIAAYSEGIGQGATFIIKLPLGIQGRGTASTIL
ncbi:PAS domain S-box protein [Microseira sp. BLCC-F43]|jgi:PAS domain S-box-containing protein|uniref:PAS domain S-box protein n=1 Tax=Microseira sp. BLCC-F43 TaxID=3153602 RepID=UPI0035B7D73D